MAEKKKGSPESKPRPAETKAAAKPVAAKAAEKGAKGSPKKHGK